MYTELRTPPRAAALLAPLTERLAAMSAPCPMHPSVHRIEAALIEWSRLTGLEVDRAAALHRVAGRAFARCDTGAATLFARWLAWARRFREESDAYAGVLMVAEGAEPGPRPVERAFAGLWRESAAGMGREWHERFLAGLTAQRAALLDTAPPASRPAPAPPAPRAGPASAPPAPRAATPLPAWTPDRPARSRTLSGPYLFDLVEPCLGVEVPAPVAADRRWRALTEASGDVVAWCGDLAAGHRTAGPGGEAAAERIVERLVVRMEELWTAAWAVPVLAERHGLGLAAGRDVTRVACAFLTVSRAHLEHLLESCRAR
ncbi:terpene synthase family protein [Planomonospora parontospora]|uniref:terpene synthase family protein n=1 Tax=Planomonospora parontospora TaxID=58119 RepID=UPI0016713E69|nr:terpene synthase family protein [Planomonospora parontospora]